MSVVCELEDTESRGKYLLELTRHLTDELLDKAMATAYEIEDVRTQTKVVIGLVSRVPESERRQALLKTLVDVQTTQDRSIRAEALSQLVPHLPASERGPAIQEVLAVGREACNPDTQAEILKNLAPHLPEESLQEALAMLKEIDGKAALCFLGQNALILRLAKLSRFSEALEVAQGTGYGLSPSLPSSALEYLPEVFLQKTLAIAQAMGSDIGRAYTLFRLHHYLPETERWQVLREALAAARAVKPVRSSTQVLAMLASYLGTLSPRTLTSLWLEKHEGINLLHALALRSRQDLLSHLAALVPVIEVLGGKAAIVETIHAIQDVGRWWP